MEIADYKKRTEELENKVETQDLKIDHLEKMLDEKILENEMQKVTIEGTKSPVLIPKPLSKIVVSKENYGLNEEQLEAIAKYGCVGHYLDVDESGSKDGMNRTDKICFTLLLKAFKNGLKDFTLKFGARDEEFSVGTSKLHYSFEEIKHEDGSIKWTHRISIMQSGKKLRFKARCQAMSSLVGYELKTYEFTETNSDGFYEQIILGSDWKEIGTWYARFHISLID
ncbi:unnamed protein product [Oikopleura dioica]|uniref:Uncharacterized protein n=1 Tax=Oikopleura dioica TaxID=34765 RepID=E4YAM4_OIKDI|nr:unnamed protein product [Oikopleura dioica]